MVVVAHKTATINFQGFELPSRHRRKRLLLVAGAVLFLLVRRQNAQISSTFNDSKHRLPRNTTTANITRETQQVFPQRGGGFLTTHTGCRIAKWLYSQEEGTLPLYRECKAAPPGRQLRDAGQLREDDTLFVPFTALPQFAHEVLERLSCNIVIISGQTHRVVAVADETIQELLNHEHVTRWFAQNLPVYGGADPRHPKISPFPYGLKETDTNGERIFAAYKRALFDTVGPNATAKTTDIYAGPLGRTHPGRRTVPQSSKHNQLLPPEAYFRKLAGARYVLSPPGDRPECHRHYEALGLGTVPITALDPALFRHLAAGPALYNTTDWTLASLRARLRPRPAVNRALIREDYWMDWAEREAGTPLTWNSFERAPGNDEAEQRWLATLDV